ncbi:sensor histidine kinase [Janthinobacterium sp. CG3]|uniref:sensor histidine kinase n=2 Tax=unclassified Janthinobacterium TaxID=2610881 RepID=UPI00034DE456|nr:ATP-binding protein [Janthinobacterium sp. CG3]MEC5161270.1 two-component system sensor histidine kinase QseC [Janthinobacterium sp. CG_S6]
MKRLRHMLRPTLVRRVVLALLLAFGLVWLVLMAHQLWQATDRDRIDDNVLSLGRGMLASIAALDNAGEARAVVAATSSMVNAAYRSKQIPGVVLMELTDRRGKRLFLSPEGGAATLRGDSARLSDVTVNGRGFRVYQGDSARWSVKVAAPTLSSAWLLLHMSGDLTVDMLIAFPFVLLPLWLSVAGGLRPLRDLSERIAAKGPDDLAPLHIDGKYAELAPLTGALDRLLGQLRNKIAREHSFVQDAAHELRTPMAVISAQAHVLTVALEPAQRAEAGQRMEHAIARASHLIRQLLDLAHIDSAQAQAVAVLDLAQLARQELAMLAPAAMARGLELSLDAPDTLLHSLEAHAFQSILQNLLTNAIRYAYDGGRVAVTLRRQAGTLTLSVADDGPGIPQVQRALVFERFYRGVGHNATGAGLGLAIVTQAVARLRGSVRLTAGLDGKGCAFAVTIPVAD